MMESMFGPLLLCPIGVLASEGAAEPAPRWVGDAELVEQLGPWLQGALAATRDYGPWPAGAWELHMHNDDASFESATGSPSARFAIWVGATLHLRPWDKLKRRDLGSLLRHECVHRRVLGRTLPRWKEEALCLWAEEHPRPPERLPSEPEAHIQARLGLALAQGSTATQGWAYAWLRAWLAGDPLPPGPKTAPRQAEPWETVPAPITVVWPPERLPRVLEINGRSLRWRPGLVHSFQGQVRFSAPAPVSHLEGSCRVEGVSGGWRLSWTADYATWVAAATEGELGADAPFEAKRALAAVLKAWLAGPRHPDGTLCPLTHCAVVRGMPTPGGLQAAQTAPPWPLPPSRAFFTGSYGGVPMSPREVWGGPEAAKAFPGPAIPEDRWSSWERRISPSQVRALKSAVRPGLRPGQKGIRLGASGPYPVETLRLEAGRRFGWTLWPSNACEAAYQPDGSLLLKGHGWGHNVGLSLALAVHRARSGAMAEDLLAEAFGPMTQEE
ncbi:MAG: Sporulation protein [Holophagaceae bacterium]|nr:Sporulation protein [Holophagaceae bacterium]